MPRHRRRPNDSAGTNEDLLPHNPTTEAADEQASGTRTQRARRIPRDQHSNSPESDLVVEIGRFVTLLRLPMVDIYAENHGLAVLLLMNRRRRTTEHPSWPALIHD
jgi:hypothetical protein